MMEKLAAIERRYQEIDRLLSDPEVSADYLRAQSLAMEQAALKNLASLSREYHRVGEELEAAREMSRDESDREMATLAREELAQLEDEKGRIEGELRVELLPKDPNDDKNVIMEVRAGAGGEEAGLFASDIYRMYFRYAQRQGWKTEVINRSESGLGAIKEIVFLVRGRGAYSRLKHESGGHRVQRIPVTESSGRIHTSVSTVAVLPEAEEVDVEVQDEDLQIDIFHSSGHGGQNVQKVATAVRIKHLPTGIVAVCQDERSQAKNKEKAMSVLRSRLLAREIERQQREITEERRSQVGTGDRSDRVRTYNFPQDRVTDHRTSLTSHNLEQVLDGDIDQFVDASLSREQTLNLQEAGV